MGGLARPRRRAGLGGPVRRPGPRGVQGVPQGPARSPDRALTIPGPSLARARRSPPRWGGIDARPTTIRSATGHGTRDQTRRTFMKDARPRPPRLAALASAAPGRPRPVGGTPFLCVTCGTQFAESARPPDALPDLRRRAAVRPARGPEVDDPGGAPVDAQERHQARRSPASTRSTPSPRSDRPAGVPDPDADGATSSGTASP